MESCTEIRVRQWMGTFVRCCKNVLLWFFNQYINRSWSDSRPHWISIKMISLVQTTVSLFLSLSYKYLFISWGFGLVGMKKASHVSTRHAHTSICVGTSRQRVSTSTTWAIIHDGKTWLCLRLYLQQQLLLLKEFIITRLLRALHRYHRLLCGGKLKKLLQQQLHQKDMLLLFLRQTLKTQ